MTIGATGTNNSNSPTTHFIIYSRSYCHLCEDMHQALLRLQPQFAFSVEMIDVDADPALVAQYDELVPVLTGTVAGRAPEQLCHYFLDEAKVRAFLSAASGAAR